jgi:hypothetical protein
VLGALLGWGYEATDETRHRVHWVLELFEIDSNMSIEPDFVAYRDQAAKLPMEVRE